MGVEASKAGYRVLDRCSYSPEHTCTCIIGSHDIRLYLSVQLY